MAVIAQEVTKRYALYNGDCIEVMSDIPDERIHFSIYSPPFGGLYQYSNDERDLSNCRDYAEFFEHYGHVVDQIRRVTMPGRMTAVHCVDIPTGNTGLDALMDFPGDIIRLHRDRGFAYVARYHVWQEPLRVRNRTMTKSLAHQSVVQDSSRCSAAGADYLLIFRRDGRNAIPIEHPHGLMEYAGERKIPHEIMEYRGWKGSQLENKYSHWIWRQYASAFWDDIRTNRVLPFKESKGQDDERHVHPLQLDVIDRGIALWTNPDEKVLTPFMGVGSEVYSAVRNGRLGVGIELKETYYRQAVKNVERAASESPEQLDLLPQEDEADRFTW